MDTSRAAKKDVSAEVAEIKACMPNVYRSIQDKAEDIGNEAFALVRRGLRGEPNCFYAFENGRVVGEPFNLPGVMDDIASMMVRFGVKHVVVWAEPAPVAATAPAQEGAEHGTH